MARSNILSLIGSQDHVKNYIPLVLILGDVSNEGKIKSLGALHFFKGIRNDTCLTIYGCPLVSKYT